VSLLLAACSVAPAGGLDPATSGSSPTAVSASDRAVRAHQVIDGFVAAARRGDGAAARALVSQRDPDFAARAAVWAANLHRVPWSTQRWSTESGQTPVPADRRAALGGDAWVQRVTVTWALPGETHPAVEDLWLTFVDEPATDLAAGTVTRLAGDRDSPTATSRAPIWLQQPVRLLRSGTVLVLSDADDAADWLRQARAAQRAVSDRLDRAERIRAGVLVVEVPQSRAVFERSLGVAPGSYAAVAAAAWPMSSDTTTAAIHVVVNPDASRRLSVLGRDVLLTHEVVHVVTRSPGSPAPTWLVEGLADEIAYDAYPAGSRPAADAVRQAVRDHGAPRQWPDEADFAVDATDLDLSYDLAWTAVRSIADAYGDDGLNRFYAAAGDGGSMSAAAHAIGTSAGALRAQWRRDLEVMARR
jgi:hypothetical protein